VVVVAEKGLMAVSFRPRRASRWRTAVLVAVHLLIVAHVVHWLVNGTTLGGIGPDAAMELGKHDIINVGLLVFAVTIIATAVFGRFFCGWGCHLIALQDLSRWLLIKVGIRPKPLRSRALVLVPPIAFAYMFLWPAAYRWISGDEFGAWTTAWTTDNLWGGLPGWTIGTLTLLSCGAIIVYVLGSKGFCTYACPYGFAFGLADKLAIMRVRATSDCQGCAKCTAACTSDVRVHEHVREFGMVADSHCMKCLDCVGSCPTGALHYGFGAPAMGRRLAGRWNVSLAEEVLLATLFALAFATFRGLYTKVPFLMTLGLAGILAYLGLVAVRLVTRAELRFGGLRLRRGGRLTGAGWTFSASMLLVGVFWGHSALIRFHEVAGDHYYEKTRELRTASLKLERPLYLARGEDRVAVERSTKMLLRAERWGLAVNPATPLKLAWLSLLSGNAEAFALHIEGALAAQPGAAEVHLLHARERVAARDYENAVAAYTRAIQCNPKRADGYLSLGALLAGLGQVDRALEVFDDGIAELPGEADLYYNSGVAHAMSGRREQAAESFQKVLNIDPDHTRARENLDGLLAIGTSRW
jgi:polyferredoxin